jgi:hypothetical protein
MARIIDLDAARVARAEAQKEAPIIKIENKEFKLPIELPWIIVEAASTEKTNEIIGAIKTLLGEQWEEFAKLNISVGDMQVLIENIAKIYSADAGN